MTFGGHTGSYKRDTWVLDLTSYDWKPRTALTTSTTRPSSRASHSSILYDGQMVVYGGHGGSGNWKDDVWVLDLTSYAWTEKTTFGTAPTERSAHSSILYDKEMVVFGGYCGSANTWKNDVWVLNLTSYAWTERATSGTGPSPRSGQPSILYDGQMVIFGGYDGNAHFNDVFMLNLTSWGWRSLETTGTKPPTQSFADGWSAILYDEKMIVWGDGLYILDLVSNAWAKVTTPEPHPRRRIHHSCILYSKQMIIFGGDSNSNPNSENFDDVWALDLLAVTAPPPTTTTPALRENILEDSSTTATFSLVPALCVLVVAIFL